MCVNADLERQFECVQQTWLQSPSVQGLVQAAGYAGRGKPSVLR